MWLSSVKWDLFLVNYLSCNLQMVWQNCVGVISKKVNKVPYVFNKLMTLWCYCSINKCIRHKYYKHAVQLNEEYIHQCNGTCNCILHCCLDKWATSYSNIIQSNWMLITKSLFLIEWWLENQRTVFTKDRPQITRIYK